MSDFYITDDAGTILRTGTCPDSMVGVQAQTGEHVFVGSADQRTQKHDFTTGSLVSRGSITAELLAETRLKRAVLLAGCDWTQAQDSPLTAAKISEWATYRQALRDVTTQSDLANIVWPVEPV